jgi:hypothetical protein
MSILGIVLIFITLWGLAYGAARAIVWTLVPPMLLLSLQLAGLLSLPLAAPLWLAYALTLLLYGPDLRRQELTRPLLRAFRKVMPTMSETEKAALNAGNVWWDGELFSGQPDWHQLLSQPACRLSEREQAFLDGPVPGALRPAGRLAYHPPSVGPASGDLAFPETERFLRHDHPRQRRGAWILRLCPLPSGDEDRQPQYHRPGYAPFRDGPIHTLYRGGLEQQRRRIEALERQHGNTFHPDSGWTHLSEV